MGDHGAVGEQIVGGAVSHRVGAWPQLEVTGHMDADPRQHRPQHTGVVGEQSEQGLVLGRGHRVAAAWQSEQEVFRRVV
ncbi:MAG: hypothetical protein AB1Z98_19535 [Nannocystaceae bacterium]